MFFSSSQDNLSSKIQLSVVSLLKLSFIYVNITSQKPLSSSVKNGVYCFIFC